MHFPYVKLYINPANHDPGAENGPSLGLISLCFEGLYHDYPNFKSIFHRSVELGG